MPSRAASIRKAYVDVSGGQVHYREVALDNGDPPLVLLHQTASSSLGYLDLLAELAGDFRLLALDTPGFGASDPLTGDVTLETLAEALVEALHILGVSSCWLYGHHTGAAVAAQIAADHPDLVGRLVLSGPPYLDEAQQKRMRGTLMPVVLDLDGSHLLRAWQRHLQLASGCPLEVPHRELVLAFTAARPETAYRAVLDANMDNVLGRVRCPTYMMGGELDTLRRGFDAAHDALPGSVLEVIPGAGIYLADELPALVADRLRTWFR